MISHPRQSDFLLGYWVLTGPPERPLDTSVCILADCLLSHVTFSALLIFTHFASGGLVILQAVLWATVFITSNQTMRMQYVHTFLI